jgi:hypothetical protein
MIESLTARAFSKLKAHKMKVECKPNFNNGLTRRVDVK